MKNLMIYVNPEKDWDKGNFNQGWSDENKVLVKVQIDNCLSLGWKAEDIILVTNFDYEYNGIKATVISDDTYCECSPTATKINVILYMIEQGLIGDDLYFFHDLDAYQLENISESDIGLNRDNIAITDYGISNINQGRNLRWSTGSIFFRKESKDIFETIKEQVYFYKTNEEIALLELLKKRRFYGIRERIKKLNITYNFAIRRRNVIAQYEMAEKPIKVIHFHPFDTRPVFYLSRREYHDNKMVCIHGKNPMGVPLVNERLKEIFSTHGIN